MNKIPNRKAICDTLMEAVKEDKDIVVLCRFFTAIGKRLRKRNGAFISVYNIVSFFNQIPNDNKKV